MDRGRGGHGHSAVLQTHHHAVGGAGAVDHRHAGEAGPARLKEKPSPRLRRSRHAVHENGERGDRAGDFERNGSRSPSAVRKIEPRAIRREQDMQRRLRLAGAIARVEKPQRRRQLGARCHQHARGARGSGAGAVGRRAKASNRIGAAAMRPTRPGTGAPSGRPTQTPIVCLPSKPTDQASR